MPKRLKSVVEQWVLLFMVRRQTWQARRFEIFESATSLSNRIGTSDSNSNRISKLRRSLVVRVRPWREFQNVHGARHALARLVAQQLRLLSQFTNCWRSGTKVAWQFRRNKSWKSWDFFWTFQNSRHDTARPTRTVTSSFLIGTPNCV